MKKFLVILCALFLVFGMVGSSAAFFIDFEDGIDRAEVTDITGVSFENFNGYPALYGDSRVPGYNTHSDDLGYGGGGYHHNGNFWLWAGENATAEGTIVDFTLDDGTWFTTGYSANSTFYVDAYLTDGSVVSVIGANNYGSEMGYLTVSATAGEFIDYIVLHDTGNYWLVDDMSGDASGVGHEPIPEPASMLLLGSGLIGIAGFRRKFKK